MSYLQRNASSAGNRKTFTMSAWIKLAAKSQISGSATMLSAWSADNVAGHFVWRIKSDGTIGWSRWSDDSYSTKKLMDEHAWYHCVIAVDTTQNTAADRVKVYVNNEQITSWSVGPNYPAQDTDLPVCGANAHTIGLNNYSSSGNGFKGLISHFHLVDGQQLTPSAFGSTDSTTGEWSINASPNLSYGTNGFFMFKDDNSANDDSGQGNNFTLSGTVLKSEDNPSNNFCVLNDFTVRGHPNLERANTQVSNGCSDGDRVYGTIPSKAGYYEVKLGVDPDGSSGKGFAWGVHNISDYQDHTYNHTSARMMKTNYGYNTHFATEDLGGSNSWEGVTTGVDSDVGDILMCAWKNNKVYFGYNGTWFFSANPSNNTDGSTQVPCDTSAYQVPLGKSHLAGMGDVQFNFGSGWFGNSAVSSNSGNGYQDANGQGKFQYQPPTGCYACCTKNLNL
jgi:hypothetical protein|tara:strand:+ start:164 stop:1510 length:1347 start_codon:yes stop_codon:yes gene_type:complete